MDMKTLTVTAATRSFSLVFENGVAAAGAVVAAIYTRVEIVAVLGSIVAATAICGMLGLFLSEAIPALYIRNIEGRKRLIANWCCGLTAYWSAPVIRDRWFPSADIELISGLAAAAQSIAGVFILVLLMRVFTKRATTLSKTILKDDEK